MMSSQCWIVLYIIRFIERHPYWSTEQRERLTRECPAHDSHVAENWIHTPSGCYHSDHAASGPQADGGGAARLAVRARDPRQALLGGARHPVRRRARPV